MSNSDVGLISVPIIGSTPQADAPAKFLLLRSTLGRRADLSLTITDGESIYVKTLTQENIACLVEPRDLAWNSTLKDLLFQTVVDDRKEIIAVVHPTKVTILIRERAEIPLRLCAFDAFLAGPEEVEEVSLFQWTLDALAQTDAERRNNRSLRQQADNDRQIAANSVLELQRLEEVTKDHENMLLSRFLKILNTKKHVIRKLKSSDVDSGCLAYHHAPARKRRGREDSAESSSETDTRKSEVDKPASSSASASADHDTSIRSEASSTQDSRGDEEL